MTDVQFYKQPNDGAVDIDGSSMDTGWYWVRTREAANGQPPIPYGRSTGPFRTKRDAEFDYRVQYPRKAGALGIASKLALVLALGFALASPALAHPLPEHPVSYPKCHKHDGRWHCH